MEGVTVMGSKRDWGEAVPPRSLAMLRKIVACDVNVELLFCLAIETGNVTKITDRVERDMAHTSRHLHRLHDSGLVEYISDKQHHYYRLSSYVKVVRTAETLQILIEATDGSAVMLKARTARSVAARNGHGVQPRPRS